MPGVPVPVPLYPPVQDKLLAEAVKVLGHPVAAPIKTYSGAGANGEGDPRKGIIFINKRSPYYKKKDLQKLAALLAHEEWHLGGRREPEALQRQLEVLESFGPNLKDQQFKDKVRQRLLIEQSLDQQ